MGCAMCGLSTKWWAAVGFIPMVACCLPHACMHGSPQYITAQTSRGFRDDDPKPYPLTGPYLAKPAGCGVGEPDAPLVHAVLHSLHRDPHQGVAQEVPQLPAQPLEGLVEVEDLVLGCLPFLGTPHRLSLWATRAFDWLPGLMQTADTVTQTIAGLSMRRSKIASRQWNMLPAAHMQHAGCTEQPKP